MFICRYIWLPLIVKDNTAGLADWNQAPVALELCWKDSWSWGDLAVYAAPPDAADVSLALQGVLHPSNKLTSSACYLACACSLGAMLS